MVEFFVQVADYAGVFVVSMAMVATLYAALGKMNGLLWLRAHGYRVSMVYVREHLDLVLCGALVSACGVWFYFLGLTLDWEWLQASVPTRVFVLRLPLYVWLMLTAIHLFNGRINALIHFLGETWISRLSSR